ncbi:SpoIID/LytB domain-containing protein [Aeromicrobium camelliae]|uniref:SpoIID/LytB domain-containing protein n=1 Tax=Aeromicrobium camelliae TaxID=1538144 RepID=A0A3N6XY93_9ACTN|nr:SpoIID/LytB domain-containing protein [Aeromicrobium camelliae]RQN02694.1 SpoIID/LytB domain-containing protein [Aeromicrobium camelliae]
MHSRPRIVRSGALVAATATALLLTCVQPTAAEPAAPAPTPTPSSAPADQAPPAEPAPEPAPSQEADAVPTTPPPAGAAVLEAPAPVETADDAISDLVTVEQTRAPAEVARMSSADAEPIIEQTDVKPFRMAGVNWSADPALTDIEVKVRVRIAGAWGEWQELPISDYEEVPSSTDPLWTEEADGIAVQATSAQGPLPDVEITTIDPGPETVDTPAVYLKEMDADTVETATVSRPPIISRAGWGAGSGTSCDATRGSMRGIVIHHTAGANNYSKSESAAIVRAYQTDHIVRQGWCDIGYNFLVDKYGQIFEGRAGSITQHKRGAHAGVGVVNDNTTGISMMGNFETADIRTGEWATLRSTTVRLVAWRLQQFGLTALSRVTFNGQTNFTVSGHRNWMATACPGRYGIAWLDASNGLRYEVDQLMFYSNQPPAPEPTLVRGLRADGAQADSITLRWNAFSGAASYRLYVSTSSARPTTCGGNCHDVPGNELSRTLTGLQPDTTYYARAVALDSKGQALSEWHATPLTIKTSPLVRGLRLDGAQSDRLTLRWNAFSGAATYRLHISTSPARVSSCGSNCQDVPASHVSRTVTGLQPNTTYYARVVALDGSGRALSDWHPTALTVKTTAPTSALVRGLRTEGPSSDLVTLRWNAFAGAARYQVVLGGSSSAMSKGTCGDGCQGTNVSGTSTSVDIKGVQAGSTYYANIIALDSSGRALSAWHTVPLTVRTLPVVRGLRAESVQSDRMTLRWNAQSGASKYWLHVSTSPKRPGLLCGTDCQEVSGTTLSRQLTGLDPNTTYYATVIAVDAKREPISWWHATPLKVATPQLTDLVRGLRTDGLQSDLMTLRWNAFTGAASYRVVVGRTAAAASGTCGSGCEQKTVTAPTTTLAVKDRDPGATYYANIQALDSGGRAISAWHTAPLTVRTLPLVRGLRLDSADGDRLALRWNSFSGAANYWVHVSTSPNRPGASCGSGCQVVPAGQLSHVRTGLKPTTTYYATVVAVGANGQPLSGWHANPLKLATTTAQSALVRGLQTSGLQSDRVSLRWSTLSGASRYRVIVGASAAEIRSGVCGNGCVEASVTAPTTTAALGGVTAGSTQYANIQAYDGSGRAITAWHTTPLTVPTLPLVRGLRAESLQSDRATLRWSGFSGAAQYWVHVSTSSARPGAACGSGCQVVPASELARAVTGLRASTTYYASVVAVGSNGQPVSGWHHTLLSFRTPAASTNDVNVGYVRNGSLTVKGHGYGHGIGMSQFGALGGARAGKSYREILGHYYSGTSIGTHWTNIRVQITAATSPDLTILARGDITFRNAAGRSERLPTSVSGRAVERWRITYVGGDATSSKLQYLHQGTWYNHGVGWRGNGEFDVPGGQANTLVLPNGSQVRYRGILRSAVPSAGSTQRVTVNVVALEDYVRGVVPREMPSSWPQEAVKAQALAARSYAVSTMRPSHYFDVCDTTACQVYGGASAEQSGSNQAIDATAGQIVTYNGRAAFTQFSSSSGGFTNQTANLAAHPYLRAVNDPWDDTPGNNNHAWTQEVAASRIQSSYPQIGTLEKVRITRRSGNGAMGGRAWDIHLDGSRGSVQITGNAARSVFGLKSDWFGF